MQTEGNSERVLIDLWAIVYNIIEGYRRKDRSYFLFYIYYLQITDCDLWCKYDIYDLIGVDKTILRNLDELKKTKFNWTVNSISNR